MKCILVSIFIFMFVPKILSTNSINKLSESQCLADLARFLNDFFNFKLWALKMFDANTKLNTGIYGGNLKFFGTYDQCLAIDNGKIVGKYCTVPLILGESITKYAYDVTKAENKNTNLGKAMPWKYFLHYFNVSIGLCVPKSCYAKDLNNLWSLFEKKLRIPAEVTFVDDMCHYKDKKIESNSIDTYVCFSFATIVLVLLGCTFYDIYLRHRGRKEDILVSFSLYTNMKKLLSTHCENDTLTCLYGIKVISVIWIIIGHTTAVKIYTHATNLVHVTTEWKNRLGSACILAAPYTVDTFLSISGVLVTYMYAQYSEKRKTNALLFYLHRLVRLMPALAATILLYISAIKYVADGPMWPFVLEAFTHTCEKYWWRTLLFVNNFSTYSEQCVMQTWYLSVDTQLYALFPLISLFLGKYPSKFGKTIFVGCLLCGIYTSYKVVKNRLGFVAYMELDDVEILYVYFSTISRMPPWLIGIYFGNLLYKHNVRKIIIPKIANIVLWAISLTTMVILVLYHVVFMREEYNVLRSAFFNGFSRSLWSLAVCFIIFSCSTGHGGFVNTFLSHPVFIVLGKFTYSMFLTHFAVIRVITGSKRQNEFFSNFQMYLDFWGIFTSVLLLSIPVTLIFEAPVFSLLKNLEKREMKKIQ